MDGASLALHVVHQEVLTKIIWCGEIGFAFAHFRNFLDKIHEAVIGGEHERVDENAGTFALIHFLQGFSNDKGVETECVFVNAPIVERECRRFAVGNHDNLAHVFALTKQDALSHAETLASVCVVGTDLNASELAKRDLFRGIVEEDEIESVARILSANQMRESECNAFRGREAIFAIENHAVAAVEEKNGGA